MANNYQKMLRQIADVRRQMGNMFMSGTVTDVQGDRIRMSMGKGGDGQDVKGPWLDTSTHRGGAREQRFFKKGQNVTMMNPGGDPSQGIMIPYGPNKDFKRPDHAGSSGQDEETYQQGAYRNRRTGEGKDHWIEDEQQQEQGQNFNQNGDDNSRQEQNKEGSSGGEKAKVKSRMHKDSGLTHRVGSGSSAARSHVHKDGATLSYGKDNHMFVDKDMTMLSFGGGKAVWIDKDGIWSSHPIQQKSPPRAKPSFDPDDK